MKSAIAHRDLCEKNADVRLNSDQIAAQKIRFSARLTAEDYSHLTPERPEFRSSYPLYCWIALFPTVLGSIAIASTMGEDVAKRSEIEIVIASCLFPLCFIIVLTIIYARWGFQVSAAKAKAEASAADRNAAIKADAAVMLRAATDKHSRDIATAEQKLRSCLPALQKSLAHAEAQEQKAKDALNLLVEHVKG